MNNNSNKLSNLIEQLWKNYKNNDKSMKVIKYPGLLIKALIDLNKLIGNDDIKDKTATQISFLIADKLRELETGTKSDQYMLNTVLYGGPGVGKTTIGVKLARIWYALGYLDSKNNSENKPIVSKIFEENGIDNDSYTSYLLLFYIIIIVLSILVTIITFAASSISTAYKKIGLKWLLLAFFIVIVLIGLIFGISYYYYTKNNTSSVNSSLKNKVDKNESKSNNKKNDINKEVEEAFPSDDNIIKILGRADLVDQYVGWTAKKVNTLFNANLGKVIFIDEAYALINGYEDSFGKEAVDTINKFLSEHPGEIIVIIGGYEKELNDTIFRVQPGFARRFMWHFECPGYTGEELFQIFQLKLKKDNLYLEDEDQVENIIMLNSDAFPHFGGDIERLAYYSKMEQSNDLLSNPSGDLNKITSMNVNNAIETLRKNNIKKKVKENIDDSKMNEMFQMFSRMQNK